MGILVVSWRKGSLSPTKVSEDSTRRTDTHREHISPLIFFISNLKYFSSVAAKGASVYVSIWGLSFSPSWQELQGVGQNYKTNITLSSRGNTFQVLSYCVEKTFVGDMMCV